MGERNTLSFSVIECNKEIMFFLVYVDMGSFAVCHCKELTENPAYRTFLQDPNFSYLGFFFFKEKLSLLEASEEQSSSLGQADLLLEKQTSTKQS